jgi:minor histocompatibility antigen H13
MQFLGQVAYHFEMMRPLLPTYLHLLVSAIFPIYTAAHASLARPPCAARPKSKKSNNDDDDDEREDEETPTQLESLTPSDAIMFPLLAGGTLASLYFILKWLQDPAWLNWALGLYFSQVGLFFATKFIKDGSSVLRSFVLPNQFSRGGELWRVEQQEKCFKSESGKSTSSPFAGLIGRIPLPTALSTRIWDLRGLLYAKARLNLHIHKLITFKSPVEFLDVLSVVLSCGIVYYHAFIGKPWFLTNFLGFSFCYGSLQYVTPTTAWTGTLILSALFFYDIYFVFFTPMMVTVATKLDVPIKLLFPRPDGCVVPVGMPEGSAAMEEYAKCLAKKRTMAMLGLGDIVVPGMILAFALRFDLYLHYFRQSKPSDKDKDSEVNKPVYSSAKGSWGERFFTSSKLWPEQLRAKQFPKPYLFATIVGYLFGMVVTVVVMQVAQHAQPALLYLVPGVLGSLWGTALVKGDLKMLWNYSETPESEKDDKKKEETAKDEKKAEKPGEDASETESNKPNGHVKGEDSASKKQKSETGKDDTEKNCRRLVYLSITLPDTTQKSGGKVPSEPASTPETSKNGLADEEGKRIGSVALDAERQDGGEPPGKRARKS